MSTRTNPRMTSRLARMEEKRNVQKITWLALGTVVVIVAMITLGIPALVRMVAYIGERKGGRVSDKNDLIPPAPPAIYLPWDATNSAVQKISGWSEPDAQITLMVNSQTVGSATADEEGRFEFDNVALSDGRNTLVAIATDNSGNQSRPSAEAAVTYSKKQPKLEVESPSDRQVFNGEAKIQIKGQVEAEARLTINDRFVIVNDDGGWSTQWSLDEGETTLVFLATDTAGNQTRKEMVVTFKP